MPSYRVKAYDSDGKLRSLKRDAINADELVRSLGFEGFVPVSVNEDKGSWGTKRRRSLKLEEQHMFCSSLSAFLMSGLSITEVLRLLQGQTRDKHLKPILAELRESVEGGRSLAQSMQAQGVFLDFLVGMVESGERSSSLPLILDKAATLLQSQISLKRKISSALTYPILMMIVGVFVVGFLIVYVVPQITGIIEESGQQLPLATRILLGVSDMIKYIGPILLLGCVGAYAYLKKTGKRINIPLFQDIRSMLTTSMVFSQVAALIKSGVPLVQALEMSEPMDPVPGRLRELSESVRKGYRFSQALEKEGSYTEDVIAIIRIGEVGGNLPDCLERVASNSWEFAQSSMQKWSSLAEPMIILVMGLAVGFVVMAVLLPIFKMSDLAGM